MFLKLDRLLQDSLDRLLQDSLEWLEQTGRSQSRMSIGKHLENRSFCSTHCIKTKETWFIKPCFQHQGENAHGGRPGTRLTVSRAYPDYRELRRTMIWARLRPEPNGPETGAGRIMTNAL